MENVIEYSAKIHAYADEILESSKLIETLKKFGDVHIGGAYELDLMYDGDIDVRVYCDDPRKDSVEALKELIQLRDFQKFQYGDFEKFPRENRPKSFIVVLIVPYQNLKWEIEIWFYQKEDRVKDELIEQLKSEMTLEMKKEILDAKKDRAEKGIPKHGISSVEIYKAILKK
jgi:hypothetical protein